MARILLIDDDTNLREVVTYILGEAGHDVRTAASGDAGIACFDADEPDLVLTDVRMPGRDGMAVLAHIQAAGGDPSGDGAATGAHTEFDAAVPPPPVIVLTAHGSVEQAVAAMKMGAFTYILKPFDRDELQATVEQALRKRRLETDNRNLRLLLRQKADAASLIYESPVMSRLMAQVARVAPTDATVLITGESGTGKELVARACHDLSERWDSPFVAVNCGALPAELLESELFGHTRGAFTGAHRGSTGRIRAATDGTLFLDEIAELPPSLQPKLLRVLETKQVDPVGASASVPVDFRLVCATNRDPHQAVEQGVLREDLYFRLNVIQLRLPALRQRPDDIPLLWEHFTQQHAAVPIETDPALLERLREAPWPGNVRELKNLNQRLVLLRQTDRLTQDDLTRSATDQPALPRQQSIGASAPAELLPATLPAGGFSLPDLEKEIIRRALVRCDGNKSRTATYLGIARHVLVYRIEKYKLA